MRDRKRWGTVIAIGICAAALSFMPMGASAAEGQAAAGTAAQRDAEPGTESGNTSSEAIPESGDGEAGSTEDLVYTEEDSRRPSLTDASYTADGFQDLVYRFENGTGKFRVEKITEVWVTCVGLKNQDQEWFAGDHKFRLGEFDYDIENGTVTLYGDALKRLGDEIRREGDGCRIDRASVTFTGQNAEGSEIFPTDYESPYVNGGGAWTFRWEERGTPEGMPRLVNQDYTFNGTEDLVLHFENGAGDYAVTDIKKIVFFDEGSGDENELYYYWIAKGGYAKNSASRQVDDGIMCEIEKGQVTLSANDVSLAVYDPVKNFTFGDVYFGAMLCELANGETRYIYSDERGQWNLKIQDKAGVPFIDVHVGDWYYDAADYVFSRKIMTGMNRKEFGPGVTLSRAQFATILYRMEDEPETGYDGGAFPDVADGQFYTCPAMWAKDTGVISGYEDGRFGPADTITREQMALMMFRYANMLELDTSDRGNTGEFPDAGSVSPFADEAMQWAVGKGLIRGDQNRINPQGSAERAQCATIIMRFMDSYGL